MPEKAAPVFPKIGNSKDFFLAKVVAVATLALVWKDDRVVLKVHLPVVVVQEVILVPQIAGGGGKKEGGSQSSAEAVECEDDGLKRPGNKSTRHGPIFDEKGRWSTPGRTIGIQAVVRCCRRPRPPDADFFHHICVNTLKMQNVRPRQNHFFLKAY